MSMDCVICNVNEYVGEIVKIGVWINNKCFSGKI